MSDKPQTPPLRDISRQELLHLIDHVDDAKRIDGNYLCFLYVLIIERFGQWRYAGAATNLGDALLNLRNLTNKLIDEPDVLSFEFLRSLVEDESVTFNDNEDDYREGSTLEELQQKYKKLGPYEIVIFGEGQAPYDDQGFCIVEVADLENHPYAASPIEDHVPKVWNGGNWEEDIDEDRYGEE